jgi:hypothetical protein
VRRGDLDEVDLLGGGSTGSAPAVVIEVCTCGCTPDARGTHTHRDPSSDWPLATAWAWLTRPVEPELRVGDGPEGDLDGDLDGPLESADDDEPADYPWWDARSGASRRRAVLPLVLLGELQAGVLLRAVYEVTRGGGGPAA